MENIKSGNFLHRAVSAFLFNSRYELLLSIGVDKHLLQSSPAPRFRARSIQGICWTNSVSLLMTSPMEILRKADAGEDGLKLFHWFRLVVDNFLLKWWDQVENGTLLEAADMKTIHKSNFNLVHAKNAGIV